MKSVFKHCRFLFFTDDLKIFYKIQSVSDFLKLQGDLDAFLDGCLTSNLELNTLKCNVNRFSAKRSVDQPAYYVLLCVSDLGVTFTSSLQFNEQYST